MRWTHELVVADDSGLEVDALDGAPGVHSARFAALDGGMPVMLLITLSSWNCWPMFLQNAVALSFAA